MLVATTCRPVKLPATLPVSDPLSVVPTTFPNTDPYKVPNTLPVTLALIVGFCTLLLKVIPGLINVNPGIAGVGKKAGSALTVA